MKFLLHIFLAFALLSACDQTVENNEDISTDLVSNPITASGVEGEMKKAVIAFEKSEYNFGEIIQGEKVSYSFIFTNEGLAPLIISSVAATCGCTVPSWSKNPIAVGEQGKIDVVFDSKDKEGAQAKDITVISNAIPNTTIIRIKGMVVIP